MSDSADHIAELVARARRAQAVVNGYTQEQVDLIAGAIIYHLSRPEMAARVAEMAFEETGMGLVESKRAKLAQKMPAIFHDIRKERTVGVIERDEANGITTIAKPFGVIAALIPSTNCEATPIFKAVLGIRARNAVICAPHPASKRTTLYVVGVIRQDMWLARQRITLPTLSLPLRFDRSSMSIEMARQGVGIALESAALCLPDLQSGALVPLSNAFDVLVSEAYWFVSPPQHMNRRIVRLFAEWLIEEGRAHDAASEALFTALGCRLRE